MQRNQTNQVGMFNISHPLGQFLHLAQKIILFAERRRRSLEQAEDLNERRSDHNEAKECNKPLGCREAIVLMLRSLADRNVTPLERTIFVIYLVSEKENEAQQGMSCK